MATQLDPDTLLDNLRTEHPRLILTEERLESLKLQAETDRTLQGFIEQIIEQADKAAEAPPLEHEIPDGIRLLGVSRDCVDRVYKLGLAWRWTGEQRYLDKAVDAITRASNFPDWNPSHFLDTAEMSHAVGLGYDWFYHALDEDQRETIRNGLIRNGLQVGVDAYGGDGENEPKRNRPFGWWKDCDHNWNQVCNCGLVVGALAIAESDPEYARRIIPEAVESLPRALTMYGPDGAWAEGPGYWGYATRYTAYGFTALRTALDTDFGLLDIEGVSEAGFAPIHTTGPTGLYLNYADSGERNERRPMFQVFWLADVFKSDFMSANEHDLIDEHGPTAQHLVWYVPRPTSVDDERPLDKQFRGPVEVALMRSAWDDPHALFVGFKAGYNQANHAHLDIGNIELDALGVRWIRDLGSDHYNLPNYWEKEDGGRRWSYWRLGAHSHNVITIDGQNQHALGTSRMTYFKSSADRASAVVDTTAAHGDNASKTLRGVAIVEGRRAVLVQDEVTTSGETQIVWGITTDAHIDIQSETHARLTQAGKALNIYVLTSNVTLTASDAPQTHPPAKSNEGVRRLEGSILNSGTTMITVLVSPEWADADWPTTTDIKPLSDW
ncbi:heparinase II/III family protein [bacterium]|nr:heparinase II/III family protein [bacterium]